MFSLVLAITLFFIAVITLYHYAQCEDCGTMQLLWGISTCVAVLFVAKVIYEIYLTY